MRPVCCNHKARQFTIARFSAAVLASALSLQIAVAQKGPQASIKLDDAERRSATVAKLDPEVQAIVDEVGAVAPEFGAHALLRVAESGREQNQPARIALVERAYELAADAEQPVKRGGYRGVTDTRAGLLNYAFSLNLDKLSLQSRAVDDLIPLSPAKARQLFEQIEFPVLTPIPCDQALTYDVSAFYRTAARVAVNGLTTKQKLEGQQVSLLMPLMALQSHAQVEPAAELLSELDIATPDLEQLVNAFALSLSQLRDDTRSFDLVSADHNGVLDTIEKLSTALTARGVSMFSLVRALREYLVANLGGIQCGDANEEWAWMGKMVQRETGLPMEIDYFNRRFQKALERFQIPPIAPSELAGASEGAQQRAVEYWQSAEGKRLLSNAKKLRFGNGHQPLTLAARATPEWDAQLADFLTEMRGWHGDGEPSSRTDVFNEKSILYLALLDLVPQGTERPRIVEAYVDFLEESSTDDISPIEWLLSVRQVLDRLKETAGPDDILQSFQKSSSPALRLFGRLERLQSKGVQVQVQAKSVADKK